MKTFINKLFVNYHQSNNNLDSNRETKYIINEEDALKIAQEKGGESLVEIFKLMFNDGFTPQQVLDIWNILPNNN